MLAHAVHLSDRELARLVETGTRVAHCPASNLFLASGVMPLGRYLEAGLMVGLGSDVAAGPDLSIFTAMRVGAYAKNALEVAGYGTGHVMTPLDWLRMGTLGGATCWGSRTGSARSRPARRRTSSRSTRRSWRRSRASPTTTPTTS